MDIQKNKKSMRSLALKATASAIIALHGETAVAASCPVFITDTSLAGILCEFDANSSVTVENGGQVGGINMVNYSPAAPSFIAVNVGGLINGTSVGIRLENSVLSQGISNNGTISTLGASIDITNSSTVSGGISNSGVLASMSGTGILINSASTINGSIANSGTIATNGVFVGITVNDNSVVNGGIINSGLIEVNGSDGIHIRSNSSINGGISNSGTIRSASHSGISVINSANILGGIENIGVISAGHDGISIHNGSTVSGNISNSGDINGGQNGLSIFSMATISGNISNSGTISGAQNGISIASSATINGAISNSGVIQGGVDAINIAANSLVNDINITGQNARIIGSVNASATAFNITADAVFTSEGNYNVNAFTIGSRAFFTMANTITALTVDNAGTLSVGDTLQTIVGNYTQHTGGLFQTGISNGDQYGQLEVTGAVDLSQNGAIYVQIEPNASLQNGTVFSDVINGNTLITPTDGWTVSDNSYIWKFIPTLNNANTGLNLTSTINQDAYRVCQGTYCQGALTAILGQVASGNPVFGLYATLPTSDALQVAASQATPELINENMQVMQMITRTVLGVVPMWDFLRSNFFDEAVQKRSDTLWIKPYGGAMTQNARDTIQGFNANAYGAVIGKDLSFANHWLVGGAVAAGGDRINGKSILSQSINGQVYQGMMYAAKRFPNHMYLVGQGLLGYGTNDATRSVPLYASIAKGSYNSWFTNLRAETGWSTALSPDFVFTPEIDASYFYINQNGYQETGSPMNLLISSNNNASLVLGAYGNGAYHLTSMRQYDLTLTGYAGVAGDVINSQPQVMARFSAGNAAFSTFGVQYSGAVFRGGAGLSLTSDAKPFTVEVHYDLQTGNNAYSNVGAATVKYRA